MNAEEHLEVEHLHAAAKPRVAVIAVHGVGPAEPCSTVRHIADLLLGLGRLQLDGHIPWGPAQSPYRGFRTQAIQVPLKPACVHHPEESKKRITDFPTEEGCPQSGWKRLLHFWDERRGYVAKVFAGKTTPAKATAIKNDIADRGKLAHEFMRAQLAGYESEPDGKSFSTIRLETERDGVEGESPRTVHMYESYWADLARPQSSILSFLVAFYQLMLHLSSLSRTAVDYASVEHYGKRSWRVYTFFQAIAVRMLVLPVPILNLILVVAGLGVLPLQVSPGNRPAIGILFAAFAALVGTLFWVRKYHVPGSPLRWLLFLVVAASVGAGAALLFLQYGSGATLFAMEWWSFGSVILIIAFKKYDEVRRGAFETGVVLLGVYFMAFLFCLSAASGSQTADIALEKACVWTLQLIMGGFVISWLILLACVFMVWVMSWVCQAVARGGQAEKSRARAALRTGRMTLAVSAALFLLVTIALWAGAFAYTGRELQLYSGARITPVPLGRFESGFRLLVPSVQDAIRWVHDPEVPSLEQDGQLPSCHLPKDFPRKTMEQRLAAVDWCRQSARYELQPKVIDDPFPEHLQRMETLFGVPAETPGRFEPLDDEDRLYHLEVLAGVESGSEFSLYARTLLLISVTAGLPIMLLCIPIAVILLGWMVAPSLLTSKDNFNHATNAQCRRLGDWLSRGLDSSRGVTTLLWHSVFTVAIIFGVLDFFFSHGWMTEWPNLAIVMRGMTNVTLKILDLIGAKLAVSGAVIAAIVYKYGRTALDIVLDVDNYLRTSPLNAAPRARIAERYVSLLRFIAGHQDEHGKPYYNSIVIVAHSLGALISADLLHYLKREGDPQLASLGFDLKNPGAKTTTIRLLTFGNPLRQLLNRFFPHLYWWVREEPDNGVHPLKAGSDDLPDIATCATPAPDTLGAALWVNAYRSGDFVGRSLWLDNWYDRNKEGSDRGQYPEDVALSEDNDPATRVELCIGLGGHNDYWDRSAPDMAKFVDALICL